MSNETELYKLAFEAKKPNAAFVWVVALLAAIAFLIWRA